MLGAAGGALVGLPAVRSAAAAGERRRSQDGTETATPTSETTAPVWPVFQFDRSNTGHSPDGSGPASRPGARWGHLEGNDYTGTPVVTEAEVFVADVGADVVRALDRGDGSVRWDRDVDLSAGRLSIEGRTLYVPTEDSGGQLRALDAGDGSPLWSADLGTSPVATVPAGDHVYASAPGGVFKVDASAEEVSWQYDGVSLSRSSVAVTDSEVYAVDEGDGTVVELQSSSGEAAWTDTVGRTPTGAPTAVGNRVILPFEGTLLAYRGDLGRETWQYDSGVDGSVAVADDTVHGVTAGGDAFAVTLVGGGERWRTEVGTGSNPPVVVGRHLIVAGTDGTVAALNPGSGDELWSTDIGAEIGANPAVAGEEVYVADRAGRVGALAVASFGGYDESTPTPTDSPTPEDTATRSPTDTPRPTDSPTPADGGSDGSSGSDGSDDASNADTPPPSTPGGNTPTPSGDGGLDLPIVGGAVAGVLALVGGGLWWRRQQQDEYDPLG